MTHRDRVIAALDHAQTDHPPFQATFTPEFATRLREYFALPQMKTEPHHRQWYGYDLEILTGQDALQAGVGWFTNYYLKDEPYTDEWGVQWKIAPYDTPFGQGCYTNLLNGPLSDENVNLQAYKAPNPNRPELYSHIERLIKEYKSEYYIIGRIHCTVFESSWALRGFENLLMDFLIDEDFANSLIDISFKYHLEVAKNIARKGVDMIWLGDDYGSQNSLIISPDIWIKFFKPRYARIIEEVKRIDPKIKVALHSDGCIYDIIPELIDIGLDVLNPIQTECLDPELLKKKYGANLAFFGGVAVQSTLPYGSGDDIKREFEWLKSTLGKNGGWLCAPTHHVQLDTPIENFMVLSRLVQFCNE